jgi:ATP-dependent protease ClpP protease subunit
MEKVSDIEAIHSSGAPRSQPPAIGSVFQNVSAPPRIVQQKIYVTFSAEINPNTTESLIALLSQQINMGIQEVYLLLSTPGGNVINGINLYNILSSFPIKLITHNVGNVDSIGNAIFLAGHERYACPHSTFMFHGFDTPGQIRLEEKLLRERLQSVLADQNRIGSIIGERTRLKNRQIKNLFKEARTKDADFARSVGIVDDIRQAEIPPGAPIFSLVFQR